MEQVTSPKSRITAKEAISERWASRAQTSTRRSKSSPSKVTSGTGNSTTIESSSSTAARTTTTTTTTTTSTANTGDTTGTTSSSISYPSTTATTTTSKISTGVASSPICQVWRHVQGVIEKNILQQLSHHQRHSQRRIRNPTTNFYSHHPPHHHHQGGGRGHHKNTNTTNNNNNNNSNSRIKSKQPKHVTQQKLTESLTQIKLSSALQREIEAITNNDDDEGESSTSSSSSSSSPSSPHYLKSVISMLPKQYVNDTCAWKSSIQDRKRAFVLLDLGRVIRSHALFLSVTCGFGLSMKIGGGGGGGVGAAAGGGGDVTLPPTHRLRRRAVGVNSVQSSTSSSTNTKVYIQPQFRVTKNPNISLLRLLVRLGVDLRCNSSDDVHAASQAISEERKERRGQHHHHQEQNDGITTCGSNHSMDTITAATTNNYNKALDERGGLRSMVDDASKTRKPDGYFRRLWNSMQQLSLTDSSYEYGDDDCNNDRVEVAVDDVQEVERISNTFRRFMLRHKRANVDAASRATDGCRFMLRLPSMMENYKAEGDDGFSKHLSDGAWEKLVLTTHAAAVQQGGELVGVSVDLSPWSQSLLQLSEQIITTSPEEKEGKEEDASYQERFQSTQSILTNICTHLRLFRLLMLSVGQYDIRIDLTGLPFPLSRDHMQLLTSTLSQIVSCSVTMEELIQVHINHEKDDDGRLDTRLCQIMEYANNPSTCSLVYTADISDHLVANAGALCARIIGVKSGTKDSSKEKNLDGNDSIDVGQSVTTKKDTKQIDKSIKVHYYIDDGCYGSLGSSKCTQSSTCTTTSSPTQHSPIPLYGNVGITNHSSYSQKSPTKGLRSQANIPAPEASSSTTNKCVNATVWGPTCDGLDRVCQLASLPSDLVANRDWLVFPQLGCGGFGGGLGLGTAFNGFDPPDVAFCVLNYFSPSQQST